ncbi:L,D-transpeptidase family protein [Conexibacter sp. W3-3-2]|uniref:L,D-transpeptidase n=1 Tax=Conexibacter sp. W3-3-2 TaxID=2675227 RepID=UPI0012B96B8E|nr:L,D-transpeptidase [Conexibacter sp. W3-3-2]MTD43681.1 L,D-transpeptidase family protein [Conexibacter sp. W3-3-2]
MLRLLLGSLAILALLPAVAAADDRVIAPGVSAGGVDLSGLTVDAATDKLNQQLAPALAAPLDVLIAGRRFAVSAESLGASFDAAATARRAADAGTPASPLDIGPAAATDAAAVARKVDALRSTTSRKPRSARLRRITSREVIWTRARPGITIDGRTLASALAAAAVTPGNRRVIFAVRRLAPAVSNAALRARHPSIVTVDKRTFTLRLFTGLRRAASYRIAHGQRAYPTPNGRFRIRSKQVNPNWYVPNAPWAGELAGSVVPGGSPQNPLRARWMGLAGGIGIHGTSAEGSIGSRASHGCVRMRVRDVVRLYRRVAVGTPVVIG